MPPSQSAYSLAFMGFLIDEASDYMIRKPKSEIQNPKSETNFKFKYQMTKTSVSCLGI